MELKLDAVGGRWGLWEASAAEAAELPADLALRAGDAGVPAQIDRHADGTATLIVDLQGVTGDRVTVGPANGQGASVAVTVEEVDDYEGQAALKIAGDGVTWVYHTDAGGMASAIDRDGNDWIGFRPFGGSDGIYRGIPNLAFPENVFHPGHKTVVTQTPVVGPLRVTMDVSSRDGNWAARWHIYPDHAEFTLLKFGHPYWLLYEGTPGGDLDEETDFSIRSDGLKRPLTERWDEVLPVPKWIAFGKENGARTLWLYSQSADNQERRDSCYAMERNMTVFGFGRVGMDMTMQAAPATFSFGFAETAEPGALGDTIRAASIRRRMTQE